MGVNGIEILHAMSLLYDEGNLMCQYRIAVLSLSYSHKTMRRKQVQVLGVLLRDTSVSNVAWPYGNSAMSRKADRVPSIKQMQARQDAKASLECQAPDGRLCPVTRFPGLG